MRQILAGAVLFALSSVSLRAGDQLLYSLTYSEKPQRFVKSEIYSMAPDGDKATLLFSDANTDLLLLPRFGSAGDSQVIVQGQGKVFAQGIERSHYPGYWSGKGTAVYELSLDSSNKYRKVFDIQGENGLQHLYVDPAGQKLAYRYCDNGGCFLAIHDSVTGKVLLHVPDSTLFGEANPVNFGWFPDGRTMFFSLVAGIDDGADRIGSYVMQGDEKHITRIGPELKSLQISDYRADPGLPPVIIAVLPNGQFLVSDWQFKRNAPPPAKAETFLFFWDPGAKSQKQLLMRSSHISHFRLSGSAKYLAYIEELVGKNLQRVWIMNLESGKEKDLFGTDRDLYSPPYFALIGWVVR